MSTAFGLIPCTPHHIPPPSQVTPRSTSLSGLDSDFRLQTAPYSVNLLTVQLGSGEAPDAYVAAAM